MAHHTPGRIFISYRREETAWPARTLYALLVETFGADQVFKDVDNIEPGDDFVERITEAVTACDILLAMIGPRWAQMTDDSGARRLDNPDDFVRIEIAVALSRGIRVVPILVDGARMPKASELPPDLLALTRRQAVEINPVGFSTERLLATMSETLSGVRAGKPVAEALSNALTKESVTPAAEPVAEPPAAPVAPPAA
ncbi:MAG: toll/interleukin-1 receptor domain-containing protein, partial [Micropruina sp.]